MGGERDISRTHGDAPHSRQDWAANLHQQFVHTVFSLPCAHIAGARALPAPTLDAFQRWQAGAVAALGSAVTTRFGQRSEVDKNARKVLRTIEQSSSRAGSISRNGGVGVMGAPEDASSSDIVCLEYTRGKRRVYRATGASSKASTDEHAAALASRRRDRNKTADNAARSTSGSTKFEIADDAITGQHRVGDALAAYLLPQGYPDSVAPQYAGYMGWRGVQYFFGGAMSVFTTRSLLGALGVANRHSGEAAAAINWVLKDGAGRMGRFLFARWGRSLDCELKQFRLAGDLLMETGAALELATALAPRAFLPLACTANLAKNLAAVAASSTRAPIYKTFARQNNMADVTAKGESVANLADVAGTVFGIALARANLPVVATFIALSVGYLVASRREVDSVELPYFNRARLSYSARKHLAGNPVPAPSEANAREPLLPWSDPAAGRIVLGATVEQACNGPEELQEALSAFKGRAYALAGRPGGKKVYVILRQGVSQEAVLHAALDAHCALWIVDGCPGYRGAGGRGKGKGNGGVLGRMQRQAEVLRGDVQGAVRWVGLNGPELRKAFMKQAEAGGWKLRDSMLNPSETRLVAA